MSRVILRIFSSLAFVQLVISQSQPSCRDALMALGRDAVCTAVFADGMNLTAICTGTCRGLYDDIINNCGDDPAADSYKQLISNNCTGTGDDNCTTALSAFNTTCAAEEDEGIVCSEPCRNLTDFVINTCPNDTAMSYSELIKNNCNGTNNGGDDNCTTALSAFNETCAAADDGVICLGSCRSLNEMVNIYCPDDDSSAAAARNQIQQQCGSGTGNMPKASGIITLLIVTVFSLYIL